MTFFPPQLLPRLCQCRYDTSPYRGVHRLTWSRLHRFRWPSSGSLVWQPTWGFQKPLPAAAVPRTAVPLRGKPQLLAERLVEDLGLQRQDALALIQRWEAKVRRPAWQV